MDIKKWNEELQKREVHRETKGDLEGIVYDTGATIIFGKVKTEKLVTNNSGARREIKECRAAYVVDKGYINFDTGHLIIEERADLNVEENDRYEAFAQELISKRKTVDLENTKSFKTLEAVHNAYIHTERIWNQDLFGLTLLWPVRKEYELGHHEWCLARALPLRIKEGLKAIFKPKVPHTFYRTEKVEERLQNAGLEIISPDKVYEQDDDVALILPAGLPKGQNKYILSMYIFQPQQLKTNCKKKYYGRHLYEPLTRENGAVEIVFALEDKKHTLNNGISDDCIQKAKLNEVLNEIQNRNNTCRVYIKAKGMFDELVRYTDLDLDTYARKLICNEQEDE